MAENDNLFKKVKNKAKEQSPVVMEEVANKVRKTKEEMTQLYIPLTKSLKKDIDIYVATNDFSIGEFVKQTIIEKLTEENALKFFVP